MKEKIQQTEDILQNILSTTEQDPLVVKILELTKEWIHTHPNEIQKAVEEKIQDQERLGRINGQRRALVNLQGLINKEQREPPTTDPWYKGDHAAYLESLTKALVLLETA